MLNYIAGYLPCEPPGLLDGSDFIGILTCLLVELPLSGGLSVVIIHTLQSTPQATATLFFCKIESQFTKNITNYIHTYIDK